MPTTLHWFKWEAYSTWLTGSALLVLLYYLRADTYLVGIDRLITSPGIAIAASVGYLLTGLALYELIMRTAIGGTVRRRITQPRARLVCETPVYAQQLPHLAGVVLHALEPFSVRV